MGVEQVEHTCKGRTCSRDMLSLLVSSHRSHYKEGPGDRMVSSTEHPRGAPIRNILFVQREGEAQAPRVIRADVPRCFLQGEQKCGLLCQVWQGRPGPCRCGGCPTHGLKGFVYNVTLSPESHQPLGHCPWPVPWPWSNGCCWQWDVWPAAGVSRTCRIRRHKSPSQGFGDGSGYNCVLKLQENSQLWAFLNLSKVNTHLCIKPAGKIFAPSDRN